MNNFFLRLSIVFSVFSLSSSSLGMIGYFENTCPEGWEEYVHGHGKFILGANNRFQSGETGGNSTITLIVENMPPHTHTLTAEGRHGAFAKEPDGFYASWGDVSHP